MHKGSLIAVGLTALVATGLVAPRFTHAQDGAAHAIPRQITVKLEWVHVGPGKPSVSKEVEALTLLTEEDKSAQAASSTSQRGLETKKSVRVLPRVCTGDIVALDIVEETQTTDKSGQIKTDSTTTQVRIKSGDTTVVKGQISKHGNQTSESLLFVTPTLVKAR